MDNFREVGASSDESVIMCTSLNKFASIKIQQNKFEDLNASWQIIIDNNYMGEFGYMHNSIIRNGQGGSRTLTSVSGATFEAAAPA
jgi:hypothetical protein